MVLDDRIFEALRDLSSSSGGIPLPQTPSRLRFTDCLSTIQPMGMATHISHKPDTSPLPNHQLEHPYQPYSPYLLRHPNPQATKPPPTQRQSFHPLLFSVMSDVFRKCSNPFCRRWKPLGPFDHHCQPDQTTEWCRACRAAARGRGRALSRQPREPGEIAADEDEEKCPEDAGDAGDADDLEDSDDEKLHEDAEDRPGSENERALENAEDQGTAPDQSVVGNETAAAQPASPMTWTQALNPDVISFGVTAASS